MAVQPIFDVPKTFLNNVFGLANVQGMDGRHLPICEKRPVPTELLGLLNSLVLRRDLPPSFQVVFTSKNLV
ncbi:hypothetical protein OIU46_01635 [Lacticaseibacillus paracasei]